MKSEVALKGRIITARRATSGNQADADRRATSGNQADAEKQWQKKILLYLHR